MDRKYSRGATLRVRLNNVLKAAGLSYPRSAAVSVTDAPAVSFGSAARMHACCRHATKLSPVSRRNNRVNVRLVRCSESAQSSIFAFAFGDAENLRQRRARALSVGNGRERGNSRSRPTSYPMSFIMAAERPSRSYSIGVGRADVFKILLLGEHHQLLHLLPHAALPPPVEAITALPLPVPGSPCRRHGSWRSFGRQNWPQEGDLAFNPWCAAHDASASPCLAAADRHTEHPGSD